MSKLPLVNVLLSTYNGARYIQQQLDSLFAQTYANVTIYIRDDGSSDNTLSLIIPYLSRKEKKMLSLLRGRTCSIKELIHSTASEEDRKNCPDTTFLFANRDPVLVTISNLYLKQLLTFQP